MKNRLLLYSIFVWFFSLQAADKGINLATYFLQRKKQEQEQKEKQRELSLKKDQQLEKKKISNFERTEEAEDLDLPSIREFNKTGFVNGLQILLRKKDTQQE